VAKGLLDCDAKIFFLRFVTTWYKNGFPMDEEKRTLYAWFDLTGLFYPACPVGPFSEREK